MLNLAYPFAAVAFSAAMLCGCSIGAAAGSQEAEATGETAAPAISDFSMAFSVDADPLGRRSGLVPEAWSAFETAFAQELSADAVRQQDTLIGPAYSNARGVRLEAGDALIADVGVWGRKIGVSVDGTDDVLIKNFAFTHRRSMDPYGSGIYIGEKTPSDGTTYISNAYIDLAEPGPNPDYDIANNEGIATGRGSGLVRLRKAALVGAEDAAIDLKSKIEIDGSFLASGHRTIRLWGEADVTIANSTVLAFPGYAAIWFGSGKSSFKYFNTRFGVVGADESELTLDPPDWMIAREEDAEPEIIALSDDPFPRDGDSFWQPTTAPVLPGYLRKASRE